MPDLGTYAFEVTLAYAGSIVFLGSLIVVSLAHARTSKRKLDEAEARQND